MKTAKRNPWLKAFAIGAIVLCILSIWMPWLSFGVRTDHGDIDLNSIVEQDSGMSISDSISQAEAEIGEIDTYLGSVQIVKQVKEMATALIEISSSVEDSQLTPWETACVFAYGGKLLSNATAVVKSAQSGLNLLGLEDVSDVLDFVGLGSVKESLSGMNTSLSFLTIVGWLFLTALVVVGIYSICMVMADKRGLIWLEAVLYGVVLLAYGGFALVMNQAISERLTEYASLVGHSIRPFHVSLLPVFIFLCLVGSTVAEFKASKRVVPERDWVCTCGVRNPETAGFCASCGTPRGGSVVAKTWICACGCKNGEENRFCTKCGNPRFAVVEPRVSHCQECGKEIPLGQELCNACRAAKYGGGSTSSTGSLKFNFGGEKKKKTEIPDGFKPPEELG